MSHATTVRMIGAVLASVVLSGVLLAEDEIVTQNQTYKGKVVAVDKNGVKIAWKTGATGGQMEMVVPRAGIVRLTVEPPAGLLKAIESAGKGQFSKELQLALSKAAPFAGLDVDWAEEGLLAYGRTSLAINELDKAGKAFDDFLENYPDSESETAAQAGQASVLVQRKKFDEALPKLQELSDKYDAKLRPTMAELPVASAICMDLARCFESQEKFAEASAAYTKVVALYPDPVTAPEAYYRSAELFVKMNRPDKAAKRLDDLAELYAASDWAKKGLALKQQLGASAPAAK